MKKLIVWTAGVLLVLASIGSANAAWDIATVDSTGGIFTDIAADPAGKPHISYGAGDDLKHAVYDGSSWSSETVESLTYGLKVATSMAIATDGTIYISYADKKNDALKCAVNSGSGWAITVAATAEYDDCYNAIALDPAGNPVICYVNDKDDALYLVSFDGTTWSAPELIYDTDDPNGQVSLAIASNGTPHVSFYDADNNRLLYAVRQSGSWNIETVDDTTSDVGKFSSIALDAGDVPHISYYEADEYDLKYATKVAGTWQCDIIDGSPQGISIFGINLGLFGLKTNVSAGKYSSLAIDAQGNPRISYYAEEDESIRVAIYSDSDEMTTTTGWRVEAIQQGDVGEHCALALDSCGGMHISYHHYADDALQYAGTTIGSTLVEIAAISADPGCRTVTLRWETAIEIDSAGFNVYRSAPGRAPVKINDSLIASRGSAAHGAAYDLADNGLENGVRYSYQVEEIDAAGQATIVAQKSATPRLLYLLRAFSRNRAIAQLLLALQAAQ